MRLIYRCNTCGYWAMKIIFSGGGDGIWKQHSIKVKHIKPFGHICDLMILANCLLIDE